MARIGVVAALPQEARILRRVHGNSPDSPQRIVMEVSGVGASRAGEAADRVLREGVDLLISWGTAAGLRPGLASGTLLLPEAIISAEGVRLATDAAWHPAMVGRLAAHAYRLSTGPLAETRRLLSTAEDKQGLLRHSGAVAADMESAAVAAAARRAGVPFLVLRAVADPAAGAIPPCVSLALDAQGRIDTAALLRGALLGPSQWPALVRLAWWFRAAANALTRAARYMDLSRPD